MRNMGYGESFRAKVIQAALTDYRRQCELADTGARPLHRPRDFDRVKRRNKKLMSRDGAWLRPQYDLAATRRLAGKGHHQDHEGGGREGRSPD